MINLLKKLLLIISWILIGATILGVLAAIVYIGFFFYHVITQRPPH